MAISWTISASHGNPFAAWSKFERALKERGYHGELRFFIDAEKQVGGAVEMKSITLTYVPVEGDDLTKLPAPTGAGPGGTEN